MHMVVLNGQHLLINVIQKSIYIYVYNFIIYQMWYLVYATFFRDALYYSGVRKRLKSLFRVGWLLILKNGQSSFPFLRLLLY